MDPFLHGPLLLEAREDWAARFGRDAPLEVEIGCGYGHFLMEYARRHPERNLVGIEFRPKLAYGLRRKLDRAGIGNAIVLRGDARRLLPMLFAPGSVAAVHIQFPDPWWKKRHHKRRLVDAELVTLLHGLLGDGGRVYLRTDILEYARQMIRCFEDGTGRFENVEGPGTFAFDDGLGVPSNRERRYLDAGTPVYRLVYRCLADLQGKAAHCSFEMTEEMGKIRK
ncbi:MAG: tRNA (guanosine(46)-N7)-methyltransferase TrmB [Deltaproteobacteria bacterium]|nr:MAG: tRNA (guanosine(46)-N7)-methyltransferase TrmB [Deltaproteobacteria bacterium]